MACTTPWSDPFASTKSPASMAMSVPVPMAMPTFACLSAGASLIPSPTNATMPVFCSRSTCCALCSGKTLAMTCLMPTCCAIACAVRSLSPVIMTVV